MKCLTILLIILLTSKFTGKVVAVIDGDTIVVLTENNVQIKVRLEGIDKVYFFVKMSISGSFEIVTQGLL